MLTCKLLAMKGRKPPRELRPRNGPRMEMGLAVLPLVVLLVSCLGGQYSRRGVGMVHPVGNSNRQDGLQGV